MMREVVGVPVEHAPVLIIGSSMVGMTLSALLAIQGLEGCVTVERHARTAIHPRAAFFHPRTMQIYREMGLEDRMREEAAKHYDANAGLVDVESLAGEFRKSYLSDMNEGIENISHVARLFLTQQMFEPMVHETATKHGADLQFSTEMIDFEQDSDGVTALVRNVNTGEKKAIRAKYMVATDGSRSSVRQSLGIKGAGYGLLSRSLTVYFTMDTSKELANSKYNGVIYVTNEKVRGFFRLEKSQKGSTQRAGFLVVFTTGEQGTEKSRFPSDHLTDEDIAGVLKDAIGADIDFEVTLVQKWEAVCEIAKDLVKGKVILAGDSAHTVVPHGGFGGNTGIQDIYNLGWKLALVLNGFAGPDLVEKTYHDERHPVGEVTRDHVYNHYLNRTAPELIRQDDDPNSNAPEPHIELGYRYHSKALDTEELGIVLEDPSQATAKPGSQAHHVLVDTKNANQIPVGDLLGRNFVLLLGVEADSWQQAAEKVFADSKFPKIIVHKLTSTTETTNFYTRYGVSTQGAVLVRPDRFVAWSSFGPAMYAMGVSDPVKTLDAVLKRILCLDTLRDKPTTKQNGTAMLQNGDKDVSLAEKLTAKEQNLRERRAKVQEELNDLDKQLEDISKMGELQNQMAILGIKIGAVEEK